MRALPSFSSTAAWTSTSQSARLENKLHSVADRLALSAFRMGTFRIHTPASF
jgi:hypothetical protein